MLQFLFEPISRSMCKSIIWNTIGWFNHDSKFLMTGLNFSQEMLPTWLFCQNRWCLHLHSKPSRQTDHIIGTQNRLESFLYVFYIVQCNTCCFKSPNICFLFWLLLNTAHDSHAPKSYNTCQMWILLKLEVEYYKIYILSTGFSEMNFTKSICMNYWRNK